MAGVAWKVELYNLAYQLAWKHIPKMRSASSRMWLGFSMNPSGASLVRGLPNLFSLPPRRLRMLERS